MDKAIPQSPSPMFGLICIAFGHDYILSQNMTNQINEYECVCCGKQASQNQLFDQA